MSAGRTRRAGMSGDRGLGVMRAGLAGAKEGVSRAVPKAPPSIFANRTYAVLICPIGRGQTTRQKFTSRKAAGNKSAIPIQRQRQGPGKATGLARGKPARVFVFPAARIGSGPLCGHRVSPGRCWNCRLRLVQPADREARNCRYRHPRPRMTMTLLRKLPGQFRLWTIFSLSIPPLRT